MSPVAFRDLSALQQALALVFVVAALVVGGLLVILLLHKALTRSADDRGDWAKTLVEYKNLRDDGVLSDEEYRKIRTLVEPRSGLGGSVHPERPPAAGDDGPPARPSRT